MVRAKIKINRGQKRYRLTKKDIKPNWTDPSNIENYQGNITNNLKGNTLIEENVDNFNEEITEKYCPQRKKVRKYTLMDNEEIIPWISRKLLEGILENSIPRR